MRKGVKKSAYYMLINEPPSTHTTDKSASNYPHPPCQPNGMPRSGMEFGWFSKIDYHYTTGATGGDALEMFHEGVRYHDIFTSGQKSARFHRVSGNSSKLLQTYSIC